MACRKIRTAGRGNGESRSGSTERPVSLRRCNSRTSDGLPGKLCGLVGFGETRFVVNIANPLAHHPRFAVRNGSPVAPGAGIPLNQTERVPRSVNILWRLQPRRSCTSCATTSAWAAERPRHPKPNVPLGSQISDLQPRHRCARHAHFPLRLLIPLALIAGNIGTVYS